MRVFRKKEWVANCSAEELEEYPNIEDKGRCEIKYTLAGAVIRSIGFGGIVALALFFTKELWIGVVSSLTLGVIWMFTGGNEKGLIAILGVVATLLYLKHISEDIIREIL